MENLSYNSAVQTSTNESMKFDNIKNANNRMYIIKTKELSHSFTVLQITCSKGTLKKNITQLRIDICINPKTTQIQYAA